MFLFVLPRGNVLVLGSFAALYIGSFFLPRTIYGCLSVIGMEWSVIESNGTGWNLVNILLFDYFYDISPSPSF